MKKPAKKHQHYAYVIIEKNKIVMIRFHGGRVDTDTSTDSAWLSDQHDEDSTEALEFWAGKNRTRNGALEMLHKCGFTVFFDIDGKPESIAHEPA